MIARNRTPYFRLLDDLFRIPPGPYNEFAGFPGRMALDVDETPTAYVVRANLPGIGLDDISVNIHEDLLSISAESAAGDAADETRAVIRERRAGKFSRNLRFPAPVEGDAVAASLENGVLEITLPKTEAHQPRQIPVTVSAG